MHANIWIAALSLMFAASCAQNTEPTMQKMGTKFDPSDFSWVLEKGSSTLKGQAFLKTRGGDVKTCAGNEVVVTANNAYTREALSIANRGIEPIRDPRYWGYRLTTICDASGEFIFEKLPAGYWLVAALVNWQAPSSGRLVTQGGYVTDSVRLSEGEEKRVILTAK